MQTSYLQLVVILGALSAFAPLATDMYLPALPTLERAFAASSLQVQLTLATFFAGFAVGQSLFGPITDRFGRKRPLYFGLGVFVASSVACALAPSIHAFSLFRFLQAFGACAGLVISRAMVRDLFDPQQAVRVFSALMLVFGVAPILAPLIGGYLLVWFGWQAIFAALAAFGLACLAAIALLLPETHKAENVQPLSLKPVLAGYGRLLVHREFVGYTLTSGFSMAGMFAYIAGSPFVFIELYGVPAQQYGWLFGLNAAGLIAASQINGRLLHRRFGSHAILRVTNIAQSICGLVLLLTAATGFGGLAGILLPLFGFISCNGLKMPNATALAMAPHGRNAGTASALMGTMQFTLGAISALIIGALHFRSAVPMAGVIALCGVLGFAVYAILIGDATEAHDQA